MIVVLNYQTFHDTFFSEFHIDPKHGNISVQSKKVEELAAEYVVIVLAEDEGSPPRTVRLRINTVCKINI